MLHSPIYANNKMLVKPQLSLFHCMLFLFFCIYHIFILGFDLVLRSFVCFSIVQCLLYNVIWVWSSPIYPSSLYICLRKYTFRFPYLVLWKNSKLQLNKRATTILLLFFTRKYLIYLCKFCLLFFTNRSIFEC